MKQQQKPKRSDIKFRASATKKLLTFPRSKKDREGGILSETTKTYLLEILGEMKYGIYEDVSSKQMEKGTFAEADAVTMWCEHHNVLAIKNKENFKNDWMTGTPDILPNLNGQDIVVDTKCPWNWLNFQKQELSPDYEYQLRTYMMLTDRDFARLAYVLVDLPEHLLIDEIQRKCFYEGALDGSNEAELIEKSIRFNMTYERIPLEKKIREFEVQRDKNWENELKEQAERCKDWILEKWEEV